MANKMLIDATHPEETRVVVLRGNRVEEFDFETAHRKQLRGNIYLAKVTRVEPSLQAAFVEYGGNRHGFLAFSEIHPDYYQIPVADRQALIEADARAARDDDEDEDRRGGRRRHGRDRQRESRSRSRPDEAVRSETLLATGENATGEVLDGSQPDQPATDAEFTPRQDHDAPFEAAPISESAGEPAPAAFESAGDQPPTETEPRGDHSEPMQAESNGEHSQPGENGDVVAVASERDHSGDHDTDHNGDHDTEHNGNGQNGHGADEEEEVVESVGGADAMEEVAERAPRYRRQYKIQEVIKRRQVMLVQVVKEERGTKGAALTTYLSLAGRYCVLMPNTARGGGISRKITSADDRKKLREIAEELEVPEGMGVILRTAGAARTKAEVKRDFEYLLRIWEQVRDLTLKSTAPTLVYEEGSLAKRSIRDLYSKDIDEIVVAGEAGYKDAKEFMRMLMPSHAKNVKLYKDSQPVFTRYGIESQLDAMFSATVQLRSGGYIVINQTEALVAIDVNSGRSTREHHIEDTAVKTNCEAAEEVARQLRLRDLAGLIVIDFIDMDEKRNNRTVERRLKDALRNDRARIQVGRISHFGLMEMSRQRIRTSVLESSTEKCPHCGGTGHVRSVSSVALQLLRSLEETMLKGPTHNMIVRTRPEIALYVLNHKRAHLRALEERFQISITVHADAEVGGLIGFTVDRGEQVMTIEQAKALLAQSDSAPVLIEEEEPDYVEAIDETEEAEVSEEAEHPEEVGGDAQPLRSEGARDSEGGHDGEGGRDSEGGRGRRRRRRGRGRGGEGREPGSSPQPRHEQSSFENGEGAHGQAAGFAQPGDDEAGAVSSEHMPSEERVAQSHPEDGEGHPNGNGEPRRRRRGRRGGRRNRRDRDGQTNGDFTAAPGTEGHDSQESQDRLHDQPDQQPERAESHAAQQADRSPDFEEPAFAPRSEPTAQPVPSPTMTQSAEAAPAPQSSPQAESPRRRSTVRESAPSFGESSPVVVPMPAPQPTPMPAPTVSSTADADGASKPRRTGWWAKRLLGGDKG